MVVTISGQAITVGSSVILTPNTPSGSIAVVKMDTNKALVVFHQGDSTPIHAGVLSVSGSTISQGTYVSISEAYAWNDCAINLQPISSTKALLFYRRVGVGSKPGVRIMTVSGTSVSFGAVTDLSTGSSSYNHIARLSDNKFLVWYNDGDNSQKFSFQVVTLSGDTVSYGSRYASSQASIVISYGIGAPASDSRAVVFFANPYDLYRIYPISLHIEGTVVSVVEGTISSTQGQVNSISIAGNYSFNKLFYAHTGEGCVVYAHLMQLWPIAGVAKESGNAGDTIDFYDWR